MAVETGLNKQAYGVTFTVRTASSADHAAVANSTRFYDIADDIIYFKDSGGVIVSLFESGGANLYTADGSLTGARTITGGTNLLKLTATSVSNAFRIEYTGFPLENLRLGASRMQIEWGGAVQVNITGDTAASHLLKNLGLGLDSSLVTHRLHLKNGGSDGFKVENSGQASNNCRLLPLGLYLQDGTQNVYLASGSPTASHIVGALGVGLNTGITAKLHVKGTGATSGTTALLVENSAGTDLLEVKDDGTTTVNGTTGIGTNDTSWAWGAGVSKLAISGGGTVRYLFRNNTPQMQSAMTNGTNIFKNEWDSANSRFRVGSHSNNGLAFIVNNSSKLIITTTGNIGIGFGDAGTGISTSVALHVKGNGLLVEATTALDGLLGVFAATPVSQPTTGITAGAFVANTSGTVDDTATYDGYTIGQIAAALKSIGILA